MTRVSVCALMALLLVTPALRAGAADRDDFAAGLAALVDREFTTAEARFRAVLAVNADSCEARNNLAVALAEQGREDEAQVELQTALRRRPDFDRARQNLAAVYVRLAAKQLLVAAEQADAPRRQALAARAREVLIAGPNLPPGELLARADQLAASGQTNVTPARTSVTVPATATSAAAASPTATTTVTPAATSAPPTVASSAAAVAATGDTIALFIEPIGAQVLTLDVSRQRVSLYRRERDALTHVGSWPFTWRGAAAAPGMRAVIRRTDWSVRLLEPGTQKAESWSIEVATKTTKGSDAAVLSTADFHAATASLIAGRDILIVQSNGAMPTLDSGGSQRLQARLEAWRSAWSGRDLAAYEGCYAPAFADARGRSRPDWRARKQELFERSGSIKVELHDVAVIVAGDDAVTSFEQDYQSGLERSRARKLLQWRRVDGNWQIVAEQTTGGHSGSARDE